MEAALGHGDAWFRRRLWLVAPLAPAAGEHELAWRACVAVALTALQTFGRSSPPLQGVGFFVVSAAWAARALATQPYRSVTANAVHATLACSLCATAFLGMSRATGVVNQMTVDSGLTRAVVGVAAVAAVGVTAAIAWGAVFTLLRRGDDLAAATALDGASGASVEGKVAALLALLRDDGTLAAAQSAWAVQHSSGATPLLLVDAPQVTAEIASLTQATTALLSERAPQRSLPSQPPSRKVVTAAISEATSPAPPSSGRSPPHPVHDVADAVAALILERARVGLLHLLRRAEGVTLLPHPATPASAALRDALQGLRLRMDARLPAFAFAAPERPRMVIKLLAVAAFRDAAATRRARSAGAMS